MGRILAAFQISAAQPKVYASLMFATDLRRPKAGFKAGDVLVEFDGKKIDDLYDFTDVLRQHKPGDTVMVKVLRNDKPVEAEVTLAKRQ